MKAGTDNPNLRTLPVAFLAGIAVGVLLTVWHTGGWHAEKAQPAAGTGASEREETPRAWSQDEPSRISPVGRVAKPASDLRDAAMVVSVVDALGREKSRVVTARLGNGGVLVLPLPTLRGAVSLIARDRRGREQPVTEVLAFDAESGLVAVSVNSSGEWVLQISPERHPLYLGREFLLVTPSAVVPGWVDGSPVERLDNPSQVVPVRLSRTGIQNGGLLLSSDEQQVVGILYPATGPEPFRGALEVDSLRAVLSRVNDGEIMTLADALDAYFQGVPAGMWQELGYRQSRGDWDAVLELGSRLLQESARHRGQLVPLLEAAVVEQARTHQTAGDHTQALQWLERGTALLGERPAILVMYASVYTAAGDFQSAQAYLLRMTVQGTRSDGKLRRQLRSVVMTQARTMMQRRASDELVVLLAEMVQVDSDYAPYHQYLGQALLLQRDYGRALEHLSRAVALDSSLSGRLEPSIRQAQVKLSVPELTEIPYQRAGGAILVDVRLNGRPELYRFVLDTGASQTVVVRPVAEQLGIDIGEATPRVRVRTASEEVVALLVTLESVDLGGAAVPRVKTLVMDDLGGPDGLLGLSYLGFFDVSIEQDAGILSLRRK